MNALVNHRLLPWLVHESQAFIAAKPAFKAADSSGVGLVLTARAFSIHL
tara:strand:- start:332 stop:478 length:147 start_codon:yes stop_codon:yes gene_type:complete